MGPHVGFGTRSLIAPNWAYLTYTPSGNDRIVGRSDNRKAREWTSARAEIQFWCSEFKNPRGEPLSDPTLRSLIVPSLFRVIEIQQNLATTLGIFNRFFDLERFVRCGDRQGQFAGSDYFRCLSQCRPNFGEILVVVHPEAVDV